MSEAVQLGAAGVVVAEIAGVPVAWAAETRYKAIEAQKQEIFMIANVVGKSINYGVSMIGLRAHI
jgi:hypothetical protein